MKLNNGQKTAKRRTRSCCELNNEYCKPEIGKYTGAFVALIMNLNKFKWLWNESATGINFTKTRQNFSSALLDKWRKFC